MPSEALPSRTETEAASLAVEFIGMSKGFFGVPVLKDVSFGIPGARICGLVGENGAGKSTLMNLLGGNLVPDSGEIRLFEHSFRPRHSEDARRAGVALVHQELNLFPNLNIAENLHLTTFPLRGPRSARGMGRLPWIDRKELHRRTRNLLEQVGLDLNPSTLVERLPAGERQLVEIAKALGAEARVLILDEPTTSLSAPECERLFLLMGRLRERGFSLIYISHTLADVLRLCDPLVVLRDGQVAGHGPATAFSEDRLVSLMVGRRLERLYPSRARWAGGSSPDAPSTSTALQSSPPPSPFTGPDEHSPYPCPKVSSAKPILASPPGIALEVSHLTQPGIVRDISFRLHRGEVLGVAGLMGAGRSELARILFGLDPAAHGEIRLEGRPLRGPPRRRIRRGLAFLTEDRRADGLCLNAAIADNLVLATLRQHAHTPARWLDLAALRAAVRRIRDAVRLTPAARDDQAVRTLSGGNQQKVVLGKWLLAQPAVLILDEPTRGIDVGARHEIYELIHNLADHGAAVLVISSEIEELLGICDRILVLRQGTLAGEFERTAFNRERILTVALPISKSA